MNTFIFLGLDFLILFLLTIVLVKLENYEFRIEKGEKL